MCPLYRWGRLSLREGTCSDLGHPPGRGRAGYGLWWEALSLLSTRSPPIVSRLGSGGNVLGKVCLGQSPLAGSHVLPPQPLPVPGTAGCSEMPEEEGARARRSGPAWPPDQEPAVRTQASLCAAGSAEQDRLGTDAEAKASLLPGPAPLSGSTSEVLGAPIPVAPPSAVGDRVGGSVSLGFSPVSVPYYL